MYGENSGHAPCRTRHAAASAPHPAPTRRTGHPTVPETTTVEQARSSRPADPPLPPRGAGVVPPSSPRRQPPHQPRRHHRPTAADQPRNCAIASPSALDASTAGHAPATRAHHRAGVPDGRDLATSCPRRRPGRARLRRWRRLRSAHRGPMHDRPQGRRRRSPEAWSRLDRRYAGIPGWKQLQNQVRLDRAAEDCAAFAETPNPTTPSTCAAGAHTITTVDGPAVPGIAGVLQAEHNLLVHLTRFPNARNLRLVLDSQRVLSSEAALRVRDIAPDLADKWRTRTQIYAALVRETRDLGGHVGAGGHAAAQAANAQGRFRRLHGPLDEPKPLRHLDRLFTAINDRVSDIIEHGARERLYFLRVNLPRIVDQPQHHIRPVRERYVPISSPVQTDLLDIVRSELRSPPTPPTPPPGAATESRGVARCNHAPAGAEADRPVHVRPSPRRA